MLSLHFVDFHFVVLCRRFLQRPSAPVRVWSASEAPSDPSSCVLVAEPDGPRIFEHDWDTDDSEEPFEHGWDTDDSELDEPRAGEMTIFVGQWNELGCSTELHLPTRLYDPDEGKLAYC